MDRLREKALLSVGRAAAFATLGIFCVMIGLSFDPAMMVRAGGILSLGLTLGLLVKGELALRQDYRRTEMWLLLAHEDRPPKEVAQRVASGVLREVYFRYARLAAGVCAGLWIVALGMRLFAG